MEEGSTVLDENDEVAMRGEEASMLLVALAGVPRMWTPAPLF